jgi:pyridoxal phosphate enzyme (YggS family)
MSALSDNYSKIRAKIPAHVTLVAVSKTKPASDIEAMYRLGQRDFGENYVQELLSKSQELSDRCPEIRWHFIGHLQTNKVKQLIPIVHAIHSVDSMRLAEEISKRAGEKRVSCFLEVNIDSEPTKTGFAPDQAKEACAQIAALPGLSLQGLMCIPAPRTDLREKRVPFARLRELEHACRPHTQGSLSMGMSEDFEIAISEGATAVRVGTLLFGARTP